jgi:hypothetical protein
VRSVVNSDVHRRERSAAFLVVIVPDHLRKVLDEVAPLVHVEHLRASADAQKWQICGDCCSKKIILQGITIPTWLVGRLVRLLAIASGVNVFSAGDE